MFQQQVENHMDIAIRTLKESGHELYKPYQMDGVQWMISRELGEGANGGILADEMGLGKTIQTISLILGNRVRRTLILVPPTLISQWTDAIRTFAPSLKVYEWYGKTRIWKKEDLTKLEDIDVVLTSYGLTYKKGKSAKDETTLLHELAWDRIVLDEGHMIMHASCKRSRGVANFKATYRWVLTGTPVHNSERDFINLLNFVGVTLDEYHADRCPRDLINKYLLRRTKDQVAQFNPDLKLPPLEVNIVPVQFASEAEEAFYNRVQGDIRDELVKLKDFNFNMTSILELLMRLRQASVHPQMVIDAYRKKYPLLELPNWTGKTSKIALLTDMIKQHPNDASLVFCNFKYEMRSIAESLTKQGCEVSMINGSTTKAERDRILLESTRPSNCARSLMLINGFAGLPWLPEDICREIMSYLPQQVLICQVQSAGTGLNLQKCSRVYFTTLLWNPALESQCIARAHRIGQKNTVVVTKLSIHGEDASTIDDRILAIQQDKRDIMAKCLLDESLKFNGDPAKAMKVKLSMFDILQLLN